MRITKYTIGEENYRKLYTIKLPIQEMIPEKEHFVKTYNRYASYINKTINNAYINKENLFTKVGVGMKPKYNMKQKFLTELYFRDTPFMFNDVTLNSIAVESPAYITYLLRFEFLKNNMSYFLDCGSCYKEDELSSTFNNFIGYFMSKYGINSSYYGSCVKKFSKMFSNNFYNPLLILKDEKKVFNVIDTFKALAEIFEELITGFGVNREEANTYFVVEAFNIYIDYVFNNFNKLYLIATSVDHCKLLGKVLKVSHNYVKHPIAPESYDNKKTYTVSLHSILSKEIYEDIISSKDTTVANQTSNKQEEVKSEDKEENIVINVTKLEQPTKTFNEWLKDCRAIILNLTDEEKEEYEKFLSEHLEKCSSKNDLWELEESSDNEVVKKVCKVGNTSILPTEILKILLVHRTTVYNLIKSSKLSTSRKELAYNLVYSTCDTLLYNFYNICKYNIDAIKDLPNDELYNVNSIASALNIYAHKEKKAFAKYFHTCGKELKVEKDKRGTEYFYHIEDCVKILETLNEKNKGFLNNILKSFPKNKNIIFRKGTYEDFIKELGKKLKETDFSDLTPQQIVRCARIYANLSNEDLLKQCGCYVEDITKFNEWVVEANNDYIMPNKDILIGKCKEMLSYINTYIAKNVWNCATTSIMDEQLGKAIFSNKVNHYLWIRDCIIRRVIKLCSRASLINKTQLHSYNGIETGRQMPKNINEFYLIEKTLNEEPIKKGNLTVSRYGVSKNRQVFQKLNHNEVPEIEIGDTTIKEISELYKDKITEYNENAKNNEVEITPTDMNESDDDCSNTLITDLDQDEIVQIKISIKGKSSTYLLEKNVKIKKLKKYFSKNLLEDIIL